MKKIFLPAVIFIISISVSNACDFCNCYLGLNPHFKKNSIGLRYHYTSYNGSHMDDSEIRELNLSNDDFWERRTNIELHGQWYPTQKMKVLFSFPYIINSEGTDVGGGEETGTEIIKGIGDPIVIAHYQLFNETGDTTNFSHRLLAGGGIKFPFGKWKLEDGAEAHERIHQPGTGSWDFLASIEYLAKYQRFGLNTNISYLITTSNDQSFQFANRFNANVICYYQINVKAASLYPNLGAYLEQAGKDKDHHDNLQNSGGTILYAHVGMDFYFKNFSLNTAFQLPAMQRLNEPQPHMNFKFITGITYAFN
jgi:hypothetical protein